MSFVVGGALEWLAERLQPPGDAAIRGLEHDLSRETALDAGWHRVCETAWTLGFVDLHLVPEPGPGDALGERHDFAPRPWLLLTQGDDEQQVDQSTWTFTLATSGHSVATLTARRRLGRVDFDPALFVAAVQGLVERFVSADAPAVAARER